MEVDKPVVFAVKRVARLGKGTPVPTLGEGLKGEEVTADDTIRAFFLSKEGVEMN